MFTRQLSTLVNAALPLESALKAISKQTEDNKLAAMVVEIREKVVEGHTLFDAFSQFPRTFDKLYCTLVMAGEKPATWATCWRSWRSTTSSARR